MRVAHTVPVNLIGEDAKSYVNRGNDWRDKGELDKAIADYNMGLVIDPKDATAYVARGLAWREKGDYGRAIADYNRASFDQSQRFRDQQSARLDAGDLSRRNVPRR